MTMRTLEKEILYKHQTHGEKVYCCFVLIYTFLTIQNRPKKQEEEVSEDWAEEIVCS